MFSRKTDGLPLTRGEVGLVLAYAGISAMAGGVACLVAARLGANTPSAIMVPYMVWSAISGAAGASLGLYLSRNWIGGLGPRGVLRALVGIAMVSVFSALIAGSLMLPVYGTMFGPFLLIAHFLEFPAQALAWLAGLLAVHGVLTIGTNERETIFRPFELRR